MVVFISVTVQLSEKRALCLKNPGQIPSICLSHYLFVLPRGVVSILAVNVITSSTRAIFALL